MDIPRQAPLVYISFSADINLNTTENLIKVVAHCANQEVQKVHLLFSTTGGTVIQGLNLYNVLKGMPFELIMHNVGSVNSIGNIIYLSGNKRLATASATFMFHGVGFTLQQGQRLEQKDLQEKLDSIFSDQKRMGDIISAHTQLTESEVESLFREAQTKDASFALSKGIIHEIQEVTITPSTPIITLTSK